MSATTTSNNETIDVVHERPVDEVDRPLDQPVIKAKSNVVTKKPPLSSTKKSDCDVPRQRKKSVKELLFSRRASDKSIVPPADEQAVKETKAKVKKGTRRAPFDKIISRLSPKRDVPNRTDEQASDVSKKEETVRKQPRKLSAKSHSSSSLLSKKSSTSSIHSDKCEVQKSSSFMVTKEPLKSSPSETSFASRDACGSIESLLSDGSTDILLADSSHDLFCSSSREDLLDDSTSPHHQRTVSDPSPSHTKKLEYSTELKIEDIQDDSTGPSPVILVSSPTKKYNKRLVSVNDPSDDDDDDHKRISDDAKLYKAKSMEVLGSSKLMTEVEMFTSTTPLSNLPSTVSVSTDSLTSSSSPSKRKGSIIIRTVKKAASLDLLSIGKKKVPTATATATITVSSKKTPPKIKPTSFISSARSKDVTSPHTGDNVVAKPKSVVQDHVSSDGSTSPVITRQGSGRRLSNTPSSFRRTSSRSSTGHKKSGVTAPSGLSISNKSSATTTSSSPAKKTTIVIKSTRINTATPTKLSIVNNSTTSAKSTDTGHHGNLRRVVSPTKSSIRRSSMQRVSSARKRSPPANKPPSVQSPSPQQQQQQKKIPFLSLFASDDLRTIQRVSSDEVPVTNASRNDVVHLRSSSEVVHNTMAGSGLHNIEENQLLVTASSVETLATERVASSMSDTTSLRKTAPTETPVRRISSGPTSTKTSPSSQGSPGSQTPVRKKSGVGHLGRPRPQTGRADHGRIVQQHSDSSIRRPMSAATRRTSSTMRPSFSGTLPRQMAKTKSDSKVGSSTLPRARKVSESIVGPSETAATTRKPLRPHSAAVSNRPSSARRISLAPTSSGGKITRSSIARRSKSTVVQPDEIHLKGSEENRASLDEGDLAKASSSTSSLLSEVKAKSQESNRKTSTALRSSLRKASTANKQAIVDSNNKDNTNARTSTPRSSRRGPHHNTPTKAISASAISHHVTPHRRISMDRRTSSGSNISTPKQEPSLSMSDLDAVKSADR